ncbi:MAG: hypothetical protein WD426_19130 [Anditalea sp.]
MKKLLVLVSICSLLLTIVPAFLVFFNIITLEMNKNLMLVGTLGWFLTAPYWMNGKTREEKA